ncbi:MAG: methyltransferase [Aquaticitalea sp.]
MSTNLKLNKPTPIAIGENVQYYQYGSEVGATLSALKLGKMVLVKEFYSDGLTLLEELHRDLKLTLPNKSFQEQRAYRAEYRKLSNLIVLEVKNQQLVVKKSPSIGWLKLFYPDDAHFYLSFPLIQGLNSSWQWYKNGIKIPVLRNKLHPYYGSYCPTRFEHLVLFDNWLKHYKGPKKTAIEVGVGCGILSLQLVEHKFQKVFATDINPNAIIGLRDYMGNTKLSRKIELDFGHLFGKWYQQTELIVFNPPWLPESDNTEHTDTAMYYNTALFADFFVEAKKRLLPEGKLVLIFSNLAQITNATTEHPIEIELAAGGRFQLERCFKKSVSDASAKTKRDAHWRALEAVELWVLTH